LTHERGAAVGVLLSTFGREALGGRERHLPQVTNGVRTNSGRRAAREAAIAYLRDQFENAGARPRASASRCTTPSRGRSSSSQARSRPLAIVAGEPFAQVFKPLVTIVVEVVNAVLNVFRQLPAPVKRAFAAFVVGAGAVVALVGAVIAAKAGFALLLIGLKAAGITLGGLMATIFPAIFIFGGVAAWWGASSSRSGSKRRRHRRLFARALDRIKLAVGGLDELFEQGGSSARCARS
jgi:hypothetical protein